MVTELIQELIGCAWGQGRTVWTDDDDQPCLDRATSITVLHGREEQIAVKLCPKHKSRIMEETTPRKDVIELVFMNCAECGTAVMCRNSEEPPASCNQHS